MRHGAGDEGHQASTHRYDRNDVVGSQCSPPPIRGSRLPELPWCSYFKGMAARWGGAAFVASSLSPKPFWSRPSARVSRSPHSHPKEVPREHHTESGPCSTVFSPHSSHASMCIPTGPFTCQPSPIMYGLYSLTFSG